MLVRAFEVVNEEKVDLIEGDYLDTHIGDLQVGIRIPLELNHIQIGEYEIIERNVKKTEIDVSYLELILRKMF